MKRHRKYDGKKHQWLLTAINLIVIVIIAFVLVHFVFGISLVKGNSMYPSLQDNDLVFYTRIIPGYTQGDILSVRMPSGQYYVKRVIATGGDVVDIRGGSVYVNDEKLEEPYLSKEIDTSKKIGGVTFPYKVDEGKIFVLGDNREVSEDSREFGAVIRKQVKGKILFYFNKKTGFHKC